MPRIAIIGTGLIGASIGLGLKASGEIEDLEVAGYDRSSDNLKQAKRMGALDVSARDAQDAVRGAAIVVLATPLLAMRRIMHEIAPALEQGAVVTDTGSTKAEVMEWAAGELPQPVAFVGGHPMAGKTDAGPDSAEAGLFRNARWVMVPATRSAASAVDAVRGMIETLGAKVTLMDAEEHDAYVAAISHLPLMAATALFTLAHGSDAWPELSQLAAGGFKDTTRLAGTEPNMAFDTAITNRTQIIHWIERYVEALRDLQDRIADEGGEEELFRFIAQTSWDYTRFVDGQVGRREVDEGAEVPQIDFATMLVGEAMVDKMRELTRRSEERVEELERKQRLRRNE